MKDIKPSNSLGIHGILTSGGHSTCLHQPIHNIVVRFKKDEVNVAEVKIIGQFLR